MRASLVPLSKLMKCRIIRKVTQRSQLARKNSTPSHSDIDINTRRTKTRRSMNNLRPPAKTTLISQRPRVICKSNK